MLHDVGKITIEEAILCKPGRLTAEEFEIMKAHSERCYREAYSHEQAMQMILSGECGAFNPLLLRCLTDVQSELRAALHP